MMVLWTLIGYISVLKKSLPDQLNAFLQSLFFALSKAFVFLLLLSEPPETVNIDANK